MNISFVSGEFGTGIELNENILLRINEDKEYLVGISLFNFFWFW